MSNFRLLVVFILLLSAFSPWSNASHTPNKAFRSFWHPKFLGERLDYCTLDGKQCGKQVANRYCHLMGYDYSSQNIIAYNIGLTHYITTRAQCKGWRCNGFMTINCAQSLSPNLPKPYHYSEKKFVYPRYNEYRVDWCYNQHNGCGRRAAHSFCSRMGYIKATRFAQETQITATQTIGSQELCFGNECNSFRFIVCSR
jgi:hypothetical protein